MNSTTQAPQLTAVVSGKELTAEKLPLVRKIDFHPVVKASTTPGT